MTRTDLHPMEQHNSSAPELPPVGADEPAVSPPLSSSSSAPAVHSDTAPASSGKRGIGYLWLTLIVLLLLLAGPILVGRFIYHATYNELKAGYDVATGTLSQLRPRLNDLELASRLVARRVEPSVVSIVRPDQQGLEGQGSGVIVDKDGYIITNQHVVDNAREIQVRLSDRRVADATIIGDDAMSDIAVLKIDLPNLIAAEWGDSESLEVGDLVWALGSPFGLEHTLTFGIVSAKSRHSSSFFSRNTATYQEYLQTDAAVNPGNSGGPLVNIEGQIVGINAAIFGPAYQGISFAIPSFIARQQYDQLRANGRIEHGWLGIQPDDVPEELRNRLQLKVGEGVYVAHVEEKTPAHRSGVRMGDVILKWNNHVATDPTLLRRAIATTEIGSKAKLVITRANGDNESEQIAVDVLVERRPSDSQRRLRRE